MTMVVCILCFAIVFKLQKALRATEDVQGLNFPNVSAMADKKVRARGQDKTREKGTAGAVTASCDRLDLRPYHVCQFGRSDGRLFGQATLTAQRSVLTLAVPSFLVTLTLIYNVLDPVQGHRLHLAIVI